MFSFRRWLVLAVLLSLIPRATAEQVLVIGDSMSKEYEAEFPGLYPGNPDAWDARNWSEILTVRRNSRFSLGSWGIYSDLRLTGHQYNVAKPGGTTREFRNFFRQDQAAEDETKASSSGALAWPYYPDWRNTVNELLDNGADRVVVFLGGDDLALGNSDPLANPVIDSSGKTRQIDYGTIYRADVPALADAGLLMDSIRKNLRSIVQYLRLTRGSTLPMVLVAVPHVGCSPKLQGDYPTDPVKTGRVTAALDTLNSQLRDLAAEFDLGFADVYTLTKDIIGPKPFVIGGIEFYKEADDNCRPRYLFSGDGFHPNTPAQARIAQIIIDAFQTKYPSPVLTPLGDPEILTDVLGLDPNLPLKDWATANQLASGGRGWADDPDGDGVGNLVEFALGLDPRKTDASNLPQPQIIDTAGVKKIALTWKPGSANLGYAQIVPQSSADLHVWTDAPPDTITANADGSFTTALSPQDGLLFLRLSVRH